MFIFDGILEITEDDYKIKSTNGDFMLFDVLEKMNGKRVKIEIDLVDNHR
jgi:hypothetical protein